MAHGKTLLLRYMEFGGGKRPLNEKDRVPRDRSLRGKARVRARKAANRMSREA